MPDTSAGSVTAAQRKRWLRGPACTVTPPRSEEDCKMHVTSFKSLLIRDRKTVLIFSACFRVCPPLRTGATQRKTILRECLRSVLLASCPSHASSASLPPAGDPSKFLRSPNAVINEAVCVCLCRHGLGSALADIRRLFLDVV